MSPNSRLKGASILIVEDELSVAQALECTLLTRGAIVVGPVCSAEWGAKHVDVWDKLDGAIVDLRLADRLVIAVA